MTTYTGPYWERRERRWAQFRATTPGFRDPDNTPTPSHTVTVDVRGGEIRAHCNDCNMRAAWPFERAALAAERVRAHHEGCER